MRVRRRTGRVEPGLSSPRVSMTGEATAAHQCRSLRKPYWITAIFQLLKFIVSLYYTENTEKMILLVSETYKLEAQLSVLIDTVRYVILTILLVTDVQSPVRITQENCESCTRMSTQPDSRIKGQVS